MRDRVHFLECGSFSSLPACLSSAEVRCCQNSLHGEQRLAFRNGHANAAGSDVVLVEDRQRLIAEFRGDGDQQAARCLWIMEQVAKLMRNRLPESTQGPRNSRLFFSPPGRNPSRAAFS